MQHENHHPAIVAFERDQGLSLAVAPDSYLKGCAEWSGGAYCVTSSVLPPHTLLPPHQHDVEAQGTIVISGSVGTWVDGEHVVLGPGGYSYRPPGKPHCLFNPTAEPAMFVELTSPGDRFESYMLALNALEAEGRKIPANVIAVAAEAGLTMVDVDMSALRAQYGLTS